MKRKQKTVSHRNPFGIVVHQRKAGVHRKPYKSTRKQENQNIGSETLIVKYEAFNFEKTGQYRPDLPLF